MTTTTPTSTTPIDDFQLVDVQIDRFESDPKKPGRRGTRVRATTGFSGLAFSAAFPTVYVTDTGDVEIDDLRVPACSALAWLRELASHVETRMDAS